MTLLDDLPDDCLIEVLDRLPAKQLLKTLRLNKRVNRLAGIKLRIKIKAIRIIEANSPFPDCPHIGRPSTFTQDQVLVLESMFPDVPQRDRALFQPARQKPFLNVLARCPGVKSIDFGHFNELPDDLLFDVIKRCPDLECLKMCRSIHGDYWIQVLDLIGDKLVHFVKRGHFYAPTDALMLAAVALKCPNIKHIDWLSFGRLTADLVAAFKLVPKKCYVNLICYSVNEAYGDTVDELDLYELNWSALGNRVNRLAILKVIELSRGSANGIHFANLKLFHVSETRKYTDDFVTCLVSSRYPKLEEFGFNCSGGMKEEDYEQLFKRMVLVKKVTILVDLAKFQLPGEAIHLLNNLDTLEFKIVDYPKTDGDDETKEFIQLVEGYIDGIKLLKKLTFEIKRDVFGVEKSKPVEEGVKTFMEKETRVKVLMVIK